MWIWSPCKSSRVLVVPFTCFFGFVFFSHFPSVTQQFPFCLPSQAAAQADPHPCRGDFLCRGWPMLNPEILSPHFWRCAVSRGEQGNLSLLWDKPNLSMPAYRKDHPTRVMVSGPSTSPWSPLPSSCGHSLLTRMGLLWLWWSLPVPCRNQISWHASSWMWTPTGPWEIKGHFNQFLLSTGEGFVNSFSGYFIFLYLSIYTFGKEIKLGQIVLQDLRQRARGSFAPCLGWHS